MQKRIEDKAIREIMTSVPIIVYPQSSIRELKRLFEQYDFNAFPVVDDQGILRGIVSKLDLLRVFRPDRRRGVAGLLSLWSEHVEEIMTRGLLAVEAHESVVAAIDLMLETRRRSLPVVEHRAAGPVLVGIISRSDLLQCLTLDAQESS